MAETWKTRLVDALHRQEIERVSAEYLRGRLLDIGCGMKPFHALVAPRVGEYVGLDRPDSFNPEAKPELVGTAYEIPAPDASFDCALSTAALEHLAEPEAALRECFRVLRPGAHAIYTVPLIWHVHAAPHDYWRFTQYGLEHVFKKAGFEVVEVRALSGFFTTFATLFCYVVDDVRWMRRVPWKWIKLRKLLGRSAQRFARYADRVHPTPDWTWMYSIVARKPDGKGAQARAAAAAAAGNS